MVIQHFCNSNRVQKKAFFHSNSQILYLKKKSVEENILTIKLIQLNVLRRFKSTNETDLKIIKICFDSVKLTINCLNKNILRVVKKNHTNSIIYPSQNLRT